MPTWIFPAIGAAGAFGFYNLFVKLAGERIPAPAGIFFLGLVNLLVGAAFFAWWHVTGNDVALSRSGVAFALAAGVATATAEILYFVMFAHRAPLGVGTAATLTMTIVVAAVLGVVFLRESLDATKLLGFVLAVVAVWLLSR